ncbi:MAG: permease [Dehalococcoidia bacterium]|nr:permease [Dehalococcoidia bacterium]
MDIVTSLLQGGVNGLTEYLSAHVLTCLVPAFFIAGAIAVFLSQNSVLRYFGPQAPKALSYGVASVSGTILAVCSCTVLPLFGGIYKRGAGLGPAVAFLYSGPAINVLAIVYSARLLGYDLGVARAVGAVVFSVVIGMIMAALYGRDESNRDSRAFDMLQSDSDEKSPRERLLLFGLLLGILVFAASGQWLVTGLLLAGLGLLLWRRYSRDEISAWMRETWRFVRLITPWLLGGVFVAGILVVAIPESVVARVVGGDSLLSNFVASFVGSLMYFATLTEVPIVKAFLDLGMGRGPALALLLAGPALSLPNMLVIRSIMGTKRTLTYVLLVVVMATFTGYIFGLIVA